MKFSDFHSVYCRLVLALILVVSASSCSDDPKLPSQLSRIPEDLSNALVEVQGIFADAWIGENASFSLQQPNSANFLAIRGNVPGISGNDDFRTDLSVSIDGREMTRQSLGPGDFQVFAPVARGDGKKRVELVFSRSQILPEGDGRLVGARLAFAGFVQESGARDIIASPGIELGKGWGVIESLRNETFRWVENDAQIIIESPKQGAATISVLVEPGPGVGQSFVLKVLDSTGDLVGAQFLQGRITAHFTVPLKTGRNEFQLHVDTGGKRIPSDPRILNFRVFKIELS